jgi:hypothetical protein
MFVFVLAWIPASYKNGNSKGLRGVSLIRGKPVKTFVKVKYFCGACKVDFFNNVFFAFWRRFTILKIIPVTSLV